MVCPLLVHPTYFSLLPAFALSAIFDTVVGTASRIRNVVRAAVSSRSGTKLYVAVSDTWPFASLISLLIFTELPGQVFTV